MSRAVKKAFVQAKVMCDGHRLARVISKSFFLAEEPERRISRGYCRDIRPRSSLSIFVLSLWPNSKTRGCPRKRHLCQKRLY